VQNSQQTRVIDPILSTVVQGYANAEMVGGSLFPAVPVDLAGGQIIEFGKEAFMLYNARRAPGGATKRIEFGYLGKPYALVQDSLEGKVPRELQREAGLPGIDLGRRAVMVTMASLALALEVEQAGLAVATANYPSGSRTALSSGTKWSTDTGRPAADIDTAKEVVRASIGRYPNTVLMSAVAFRACKNNPAIIDRFKYTGRDSITPDLLASLFDVEKVVVGKAVTANPQTGAFADVWGNNVVVAYIPAEIAGQEQPSYGYTYTMRGHPLVETPYYDNNAKSWIYPVTNERAPVLTGIAAGYLIQNPN
jgi:hypothetical protein